MRNFFWSTRNFSNVKLLQHPGLRETAPSLGSRLGNRLPAWVPIWVSLVKIIIIQMFLFVIKCTAHTTLWQLTFLTIRPFWLLVRSIYDSFKYQGLVNTFAPLAQDDTDLFFSGIFSIFHLHRPDQRHDLLPIYPCPLVSFSWCDIQDLGHFNPTSLFSQIPIFPPQVVLRSEHLCLGAVCVAHR